MKKVLLYFLLICLGGALSNCNGEGEDPSFKDECLSNPVLPVVSSQTHASVGRPNGSLTISVKGGSGQYTYSINGVDFQKENTFYGLEAGDHNITVKDSDGCSRELMARIIESFGNPPSFKGEIQPIIAARCAISGCHVTGGAAPLELTNYTQINASAKAIKNSVQARIMPPSGSIELTANQIQLIVEWVDVGSPNN